jgi:hypothetical protein
MCEARKLPKDPIIPFVGFLTWSPQDAVYVTFSARRFCFIQDPSKISCLSNPLKTFHAHCNESVPTCNPRAAASASTFGWHRNKLRLRSSLSGRD